jgi:hypothetical protein
MPRFRADRLELMASFRSATAAGQLMAFAQAVLSREVGYVQISEAALECLRRRWKTPNAAANR